MVTVIITVSLVTTMAMQLMSHWQVMDCVVSWAEYIILELRVLEVLDLNDNDISSCVLIFAGHLASLLSIWGQEFLYFHLFMSQVACR